MVWKPFTTVLGLGCTLFGTGCKSSEPPKALDTHAAPAYPFHTSSRWILDKNNQRVKFRCVNWAGHMETHLPEGLHKQSVDYLASWIANAGFNCVRLTYSDEMALIPDQKASDAWTDTLNKDTIKLDDAGKQKFKDLWSQVVQKNPFVANATTLETYGKIIEALGKNNIAVVLDNHVSKAKWCCDPFDGNGWWDEATPYTEDTAKYFNTKNWVKSLTTMATFSKYHQNVVGMSLRNELRPNVLQDNKSDWYKFVTLGAQTIHAQNSDLLIVIGGTRSSADMRMVFDSPLDTSGWKDRTVWEFHAYWWTYPLISAWCPTFNAATGFEVGFLLEQNKPYTGPLWLSEFGFGMTGGPHDGLSDNEDKYLTCLSQYMQSNDADWAIWAIQGSYYVRDSDVDHDESYGVLDKDWKDWRNPKVPARLGSMWNITQTP